MCAAHRTVIVSGASRRWNLLRPSRWLVLLTRWRASDLDAQLAAGQPPEGDPQRAVRAAVLVEPANRRQLAECWQAVLSRAARPPDPIDSRVPLRRSQVLAADADIRRMIAGLRAPSPVPARGVAIASGLLSDGTGPLYNERCRQNLRTVVRSAVRHLDPSAGLTA
jgi:hypothetical protein